jgi:hypothetical protein
LKPVMRILGRSTTAALTGTAPIRASEEPVSANPDVHPVLGPCSTRPSSTPTPSGAPVSSMSKKSALRRRLAARHALAEEPQREALDVELPVGVLRDEPGAAGGLLADARGGRPAAGQQDLAEAVAVACGDGAPLELLLERPVEGVRLGGVVGRGHRAELGGEVVVHGR